MAETIKAKVTRYKVYTNNWVVLYCEQKGKSFRAAGTIVQDPSSLVGVPCTLRGTWDRHAKYGLSFKISSLTPDGSEMFYFLTRVSKIGEKQAQAMVDTYTDSELTSIMETPERHNELLSIKGIGKSRLDNITASWQKYRHIKLLSDFLSPHGITPGLIVRIYNHYEDRSVSVIRDNPYNLTRVSGIGFKKADDVALKIGIDPHDTYRLAACLRFVMSSMADDNGNTLVAPDDVVAQAVKELECDSGSIETDEIVAELAQMEEREEVVRMGDMLALNRHFVIEKRICDTLQQRTALPPIPLKSPAETQRFIISMEREMGITFSDEQAEAIKLVAAGHRTIAVTGYAGTGKSTVSKALIKLLLSKYDEDDVCCMALSGIASDRIRKSSGFSAYTIHTALGWRGKEFEHGPGNPLGYQVVLLDEGSMVNSFIMRQLVDAVDRDAVLILMGDPGQIPPIGAGDPFRNIIDGGIIPVAKLTRIYRQSDDSVLSVFADDVRRGVVPDGYLEEGFKDFRFVRKDLPGNYYRLTDKEKLPLREQNAKAIQDFIEEKMVAIAPYISNIITDFQVLSPIRKGPLGTETLNFIAQKVFNPGDHAGRSIQVGGVTFKPGDKVVHTLNRDMQIVKARSLSDANDNPESPDIKRVFNGSVGVILDADSDSRELLVAYPEGFIAKYDSLLLSSGVLELAYALTAHKCQGSEYRFVLIPLSSAHMIMLTAQWLYTAVTRAKEKVLIVGQKYMFERACKSLTETKRTTVLEKLVGA